MPYGNIFRKATEKEYAFMTDQIEEENTFTYVTHSKPLWPREKKKLQNT
jgi:hypothetical protein